MKKYADPKNTILSSGNSVYQIIADLATEALNSKEVREVISKKSETTLSEIINQITVNNFEPGNAIITTEEDESAIIASCHMNSSQVVQKISEKAISELLKKIPEIYTELLDENIENSYNLSIIDFIKKPKEKFSELTQDSLNNILKEIENSYLSISIEDFSIDVKNKETEVTLGLKISIKPLYPYVRILFEANGIKKQLSKISFTTEGILEFSGMKLNAQKKKLEIKFGKLDAEFKIFLKKVELLNQDVMSSDENNPRELFTVKVPKKLPSVTLQEK